jgi:hypothetical protein
MGFCAASLHGEGHDNSKAEWFIRFDAGATSLALNQLVIWMGLDSEATQISKADRSLRSPRHQQQPLDQHEAFEVEHQA